MSPLGPDGLTERERIVVEMLAAGSTIRAIAIKIGVTEKTIFNCRKKPHIQEAIYARQTETFDGSGGQGLSLLPEVVKTLQSIINDPLARDADRVQACRTLMSAANEYQARKTLERQIRDLEQRLFQEPAPTGRPAGPPPITVTTAADPGDLEANLASAAIPPQPAALPPSEQALDDLLAAIQSS